jgi:hypothetical protein
MQEAKHDFFHQHSSLTRDMPEGALPLPGISPMVKIFEVAFLLEVTLLPALWLVFRATLIHTQHQ